MKTFIWILLFASLQLLEAESADFLQLVKDIQLPGKATRFDYQSWDVQNSRLYISHMGDGELVVFDTKAERVAANIPGFPVMTGVLVVPSLKKVYGSVTKNHEMAVVNTETLTVIKRIPDGRFPDGLAYSPDAHRVFVSDESGQVETVIDAIADKKIGIIEMGGRGRQHAVRSDVAFNLCMCPNPQPISGD